MILREPFTIAIGILVAVLLLIGVTIFAVNDNSCDAKIQPCFDNIDSGR